MSAVTREERVLHHLPLVWRVARAAARRLPDAVEVDDLVSVGLIGLIEAVDRHPDLHGAAFADQARLRVRQAIIDELRHVYGRAAPRSEPDEVTEELADPAESPELALERSTTLAELLERVERLPERERAIVRGYDLDGRGLRLVAADLGISESYASILRTRALGRLEAARAK